jgi:dienelactone hydrolase
MSMSGQPTLRTSRLVSISIGEVALEGDLNIPARAMGVVVFAHGSGSSRFSSRNRFVASALEHAGLATLLMDLLTRDEEVVDQLTAHLRFDIELLAERLVAATDWLAAEEDAKHLPIGYFGASTGAAAALVAAAERPEVVRAAGPGRASLVACSSPDAVDRRESRRAGYRIEPRGAQRAAR